MTPLRVVWCPGPESNRYSHSRPADFTYHYSFRYRTPTQPPSLARLWSGLSLYLMRVAHVGRGRLVSTLSSLDQGGLARDYHQPMLEGFPEFDP